MNRNRIPKILANVDISGLYGEGVITANPHSGYVYWGCSGQVAVIKGTQRVSVLPTGLKRCSAIAADKSSGWIYALGGYSDTVAVMDITEYLLQGGCPADLVAGALQSAAQRRKGEEHHA